MIETLLKSFPQAYILLQVNDLSYLTEIFS